MSLICGCSSSGGGGATIAAGAKPFYRYALPSRLPLFLTPARNETTFPCKSPHKASALVVRPIRASSMDSFEKSSDFVKRMELAWVITQQPRPVACSSCASKGHVECKWCGGTGFFVIGNNLLCEFPSRNTSCLICAAKGSVCCADCKGTGFRAKWLSKPPP